MRRLRRLLRPFRLLLLAVLTAMAIGAILGRNWEVFAPAVVFIVLLLALEALERGLIGGGGGGRGGGG